MRAILMASLALFPLGANAGELEISNFRSGLACINTTLVEGESGWICHATETILMTDQGTCVFNKKQRHCTWYGFEFEYKGAGKGTKLQCATRNSQPVVTGNPRERMEEDVLDDSYELELPQSSGRFFNAQYSVFSVMAEAKRDLLLETTCRHQDKVVFTYKLHIRYPVLPAP